MKYVVPLVYCLLLSLPPATAATVSTVAGTGEKGSSGANVKATESKIANPYGLTIGPDGALYFCEIDNHLVRRLDLKTGIMTTAAGNGSQGYSGDGGPANSAALYEPYEVRFDRAGNMYFVEMKNHIVRKVDAKTKNISTIAGTGEPGFSGDGGPAAKAQLQQPHSISLDGKGSLYIADIRNNRIRRVDLKSGIISTFAGGEDPVTHTMFYTGSHTSRTARIEPITPPGQVYTSSAFAAVAAATGVDDLGFSYIGRIPLAKQYGSLALYQGVYSFRGFKGRGIWPDLSTDNIPLQFYYLALQLAQAVEQQGGSPEVVAALRNDAVDFRVTASGGALALADVE